MIIAIISPIRFKKEMLAEYTRLSMEGHIVLLPVDIADIGLGAEHEADHKEQLMALHKQKIDKADKVRVLNVGGYMGRGTFEEIGYSVVKGKPIEYLEPINNEVEVPIEENN